MPLNTTTISDHEIWSSVMLRILSKIALEEGFEKMDYPYFQKGEFILVSHKQSHHLLVTGGVKNVLYLTDNDISVEIWNDENEKLNTLGWLGENNQNTLKDFLKESYSTIVKAHLKGGPPVLSKSMAS